MMHRECILFHLLDTHMPVMTIVNTSLCCCDCVVCFGHWLTPLFVESSPFAWFQDWGWVFPIFNERFHCIYCLVSSLPLLRSLCTQASPQHSTLTHLSDLLHHAAWQPQTRCIGGHVSGVFYGIGSAPPRAPLGQGQWCSWLGAVWAHHYTWRMTQSCLAVTMETKSTQFLRKSLKQIQFWNVLPPKQ